MPRSQVDKNELLLPRPGLCSHSFSKACRLLTMLVCILPRVLEACVYAFSVDRPQNTINGRSEMSVALLLCLCINSGACVCNQAGLHLPVGCSPASLSCFIVLEIWCFFSLAVPG